jgi:hypothetical protein
LQEFLGRRALDRHLDADEAVVLGASLHAANLSDGIKLNRKLGMIDGSTYAFMLEIDEPDYDKDESIDQVLVPRMKKMPIKVGNFISFCHQTICEISIWHVARYICSIFDISVMCRCLGLSDIPRTFVFLSTMIKHTSCLQVLHHISLQSILYQA